MGVDHHAVFGIGSRITKVKGEQIEDFVKGKDYHEAFEKLLKNCEYTWGESGDWAYTGDPSDAEFYIFLECPVLDYTMGRQIRNMERWMKKNEIEGTAVDLRGGVHTY